MATAADVLQVVRSQIGVSEKPAGSNLTPYGQWYGLNGVPWCAIFVSWCLHQAGISLPIETPKGFHYCPSGVDYFKKQDRWITQDFQPGDIIFFDWKPSNGRPEAFHVGIVESV